MISLKTLEDLVSIKSFENQSEITEYIKEKLKDTTEQTVELLTDKNKKSLIFGINTKLKNGINPIILSGHIDTVKPKVDEYKTNPYKLELKGKKAVGLGIIDMKCFTSTVIDNIEKIKQLNSPVILCLTPDEETDLLGVNNIVEYLKQNNILPKYTLVGEPTAMELKNISNGCYEYEIEVKGKSCHSSFIEKGINAICIVAKLVSYIESLNKSLKLTTLNCGIIGGGEVVNKVPDFAYLRFDIRTTNNGEYEIVKEKINKKIKQLKQEYLGCEISLKQIVFLPSFQTKDDKFLSFLSEKYNLNISKFNGGCEAGFFTNLSGDGIIFGTGDLSLAHKPNEFMDINDYEKYQKLFIEILTEIDKYDKNLF